jgi:hypothetical protein
MLNGEIEKKITRVNPPTLNSIHEAEVTHRKQIKINHEV